MKITATKQDYIWSYFAYLLKFGINLFVFPVVLNILDTAEYGLWVTFSSVTLIVNLFDFGFSSTILRNLTYVWSGATKLQSEGCDCSLNGEKRNNKLFLLTVQTCKKIYVIIGLLAFVGSATLGTAYILYVIRDMYRIEYLIAWIVSVAGVSMNLYCGCWNVLLKGVGAIKQSQKANVVGYLIQLIISYVGLLCGFGLLALSVSTCVCGIVIRALSYHFFSRYEDVKEVLNLKYQITKSEIKDTFNKIWYNAKKAGVSSIATVFMTQSTTVICSACFGVVITGEYGICIQILNTLTAISQIFYQTSIPELTQLRQYNLIEQCKKRLSTSICIAWGMFLMGVVSCVLFGNFLLGLIHSQTSLNLIMFAVIAFFSFGEMNYSIHASFISLENKLPFVPSVIITSIATVALSILSIWLPFGIWGLLFVRCIIEAAYVFWKWPASVYQQLSLNPWKILKIGSKELLSMFCRLINNKQTKSH